GSEHGSCFLHPLAGTRPEYAETPRSAGGIWPERPLVWRRPYQLLNLRVSRGPGQARARGRARGPAPGPAPGPARGPAQYRPRPNRRERSGCLPGCYQRQPRDRCRGCGSSSRLRFENLHERLGIMNADSELSLTTDSDKVVLPQRGQAGTILGGGQVQRRLIGNVVADAADLAPEDLREVTQV